jgi:hypothetical protein
MSGVSQSQLRTIIRRWHRGANHPEATEAQLFDCVSQILAHMNKPAGPALSEIEIAALCGGRRARSRA